LEEGNTLNGGRGGRRFVRKTDKKGGRYSLESTVRAEKRGGQTLYAFGHDVSGDLGKREKVREEFRDTDTRPMDSAWGFQAERGGVIRRGAGMGGKEKRKMSVWIQEREACGGKARRRNGEGKGERGWVGRGTGGEGVGGGEGKVGR